MYDNLDLDEVLATDLQDAFSDLWAAHEENLDPRLMQFYKETHPGETRGFVNRIMDRLVYEKDPERYKRAFHMVGPEEYDLILSRLGREPVTDVPALAVNWFGRGNDLDTAQQVRNPEKFRKQLAPFAKYFQPSAGPSDNRINMLRARGVLPDMTPEAMTRGQLARVRRFAQLFKAKPQLISKGYGLWRLPPTVLALLLALGAGASVAGAFAGDESEAA